MDNREKIPYEQLLNKRGRSRLPDKLMDHLNNEALNDVVWWLPEGTAFAMDSKTVQEKFLDIHFRGTKLTSFIRSLNRWGFRRVFFQAMPRNAICFQAPQFKRAEPELLREMKLAPTTSSRTTSIGVTATPAAGATSSVAQAMPDPGASSSVQREDPFGDGRFGAGVFPGRDQLLRGLIPQQGIAASLRASNTMGNEYVHLSQSESAPFSGPSVSQARAANLIATERRRTGLPPRADLSSFVSDTMASTTRFSRHPLMPTDAVRQDALLAVLQREELMQQLQGHRRQRQQPYTSIWGQERGDNLASAMFPSSGSVAGGAASSLLQGQLQQARQVQQIQQEQQLQYQLRLRQQQLLTNQLFASTVVGHQNPGETKQDPDPRDHSDDLIAYLRLNQR